MNATDQDRVTHSGLLRLTSWATAAAVALTVASLASLSQTGSQRVGVAIASLTGGGVETRQVAQLARREADIENERRSLNETFRLLASDRDRLATRVGSLERNLDDITGSIKSQIARPSPPKSQPQQPEADPLDALPEMTPDAPPDKAAAVPAWLANLPEPWPATAENTSGVPANSFPPVPVRVSALPETTPPATVASRTEFGIDIGSGSNLGDVRLLWNAARTQHGRLIGNLRPLVVKREDARGGADYRLIVGPFANAGAAARICASLGAADVMCSTRTYQGERLAP